MNEYEVESRRLTLKIVRWVITTLVLFILGFSFGCPVYNVWERRLAGKAELAQAEYNRRIAVQEAQAKHDAAKELALAEVERAKGVAKANLIVGESLKGHVEYLQYLWIQNLHDSNTQLIYVPLTGQLPIPEAGRFLAPTPER